MSSDPDRATIDADLRAVLGGSFSADDLAGGLYDEITARVNASPGLYVEAFERDYLGANFDPRTHARIFPTALVELLRTGGAEAEYRALGEALLRHYSGALMVFDDATDTEALAAALPERSMRLLAGLDSRRQWLRAVLERED